MPGSKEKNITFCGNITILFYVYQSDPCFNGDHYNTYLWVDNVKIKFYEKS